MKVCCFGNFRRVSDPHCLCLVLNFTSLFFITFKCLTPFPTTFHLVPSLPTTCISPPHSPDYSHLSPLAEILNLRKGMWSAVRAISHPLLKLFPFGANATEFMVCGTVSYEFKEGGSVTKDWAGRAELVKEGEGWKLRMYQVYLVSG